MFGKNEIVGRRYFSDSKDKLLVTSVFATLQGEGPYRGKLCVFVRLAKCQLSCSFCDTYFDNGDWLTYQELNDKIDAAMTSSGVGNIPHGDIGLVITGGEPALQHTALQPFLWKATAKFGWVQIETNGLATMPDLPPSVCLVVSPKCLEKQGLALRYYELPQATLTRADCLKFVMNSDSMSPYSSIPAWALDWTCATGKDVFVSPMNMYNSEPREAKIARAAKQQLTLEQRSVVDEVVSFWEPRLLDMEANARNHMHAARYAMEHNLIFQVQLHLFAGLP